MRSQLLQRNKFCSESHLLQRQTSFAAKQLFQRDRMAYVMRKIAREAPFLSQITQKLERINSYQHIFREGTTYRFKFGRWLGLILPNNPRRITFLTPFLQKISEIWVELHNKTHSWTEYSQGLIRIFRGNPPREAMSSGLIHSSQGPM